MTHNNPKCKIRQIPSDWKLPLEPYIDSTYKVLVMVLNQPNSTGMIFEADPVIKLLEDKGSVFMKNVESGELGIEMGSPERSSDMTNGEYFKRLSSIDLSNVGATISDIELDYDYGKTYPELNAPDAIAVYARLRPTGLKKEALIKALTSTESYPSFGSRSLVRDPECINGVVTHTVVKLISFDYLPDDSFKDKQPKS